MTKKLTKAEKKKVTRQYRSGLKRSLDRIDKQSFEFYSVKLLDPRLVKFLLGKSYIESLYLPNLVEKLIRKGLEKDKTYQDYMKNDLAIKIEIQPTLRFYSKSWAEKKEKAKKSGQS